MAQAQGLETITQLRTLPLPGRSDVGTRTDSVSRPANDITLPPTSARRTAEDGGRADAFVTLGADSRTAPPPLTAATTAAVAQGYKDTTGPALSDAIVSFLLKANETRTRPSSPSSSFQVSENASRLYRSAAGNFPASQPSLFRLGI